MDLLLGSERWINGYMAFGCTTVQYLLWGFALFFFLTCLSGKSTLIEWLQLEVRKSRSNEQTDSWLPMVLNFSTDAFRNSLQLQFASLTLTMNHRYWGWVGRLQQKLFGLKENDLMNGFWIDLFWEVPFRYPRFARAFLFQMSSRKLSG